MIRFACPACQKALKAPDDSAGRKTHCPRCGQRLLVPPPVQVQNKTVLGQPLSEPAATVPSAKVFTLFCPNCNARMLVEDAQADEEVECLRCGKWFAVGGGTSIVSDNPTPSSASRGTAEMKANSNTPPNTGLSCCPYCGSTWPPRTKRRVSPIGWVVMAIGLMMAFGSLLAGCLFFPLWIATMILVPLSAMGLLITTEEKVCSQCNRCLW